MASLRRALACCVLATAAVATLRLTYKPKVIDKPCLAATWGAAVVKGRAALVARVPEDVVCTAQGTSLDSRGHFLACGAVELRKMPCDNQECIVVVARGHPGATSLRVVLHAAYSSQKEALADPGDDGGPLPFLGAILADLVLKLPNRRAATSSEKPLRGSHSLAQLAQKALKQETDDDCSRPRWVATEKALFGRKDRRPMCGYTSFAHPYAKRGPIARSYATTCAPPPSVTLPSLEKCVKGVVFAGDSIMRHVADFLRCELGHRRVAYTSLRGTSANVTNHIAQLAAVAHPQKTLVLNVAGLWQVAYGRSDAYERAVARVLEFSKRRFGRVVLAATTAVFPEHFLGRSACPRAGAMAAIPLSAARGKRAMTSLRVVAANAAAARAAATLGVDVVDVYAPTALAWDDPLTPDDMRHFGSATTAAIARLMVEAACPALFGAPSKAGRGQAGL